MVIRFSELYKSNPTVNYTRGQVRGVIIFWGGGFAPYINFTVQLKKDTYWSRVPSTASLP